MGLIKIQNTEHRIQNTDNEGLGSDEGHGGNIYKIAEELGIPEGRLIDFSASINPLGVSQKVKDVIKKELDNLVNYPDPDTKDLRYRIAKHHDIDPETILCGNGSTELIYLIPRAMSPQKVLITAPTFSEYERAVRTQNTEHRAQTKEIILKKADNFRIDAEEFVNAMHDCNMAFLCNPNNPTGTLLGREEVLEIAEAAKKEKCLLVVDEAFIDFCPEASVIGDVQNNPYLIVLRSMTKFYALAGLRIGYGVFHKDLIKKVKQFKEPWTVNNLAQKAAIIALEDSDYINETMILMENEKEFLEKGFEELNIEFFPSAANYYLLKIDNAGGVVKELREKGILVRDCSNFKVLDGSYIRVAVKSREHNGILLKELSKSCGA